MKNQLLGCTALFLSSSAAIAAPLVTGNTISWPDDGWYQVQDEQSYTEICSGTRFCAVEPGSYIVVNHSTGERFEGVKVTGDSEPASSVTVSGNVISWPDDGWYQVQNAATFTSFCEGAQSCNVEPGNYIVINHTTGQRFENINVEGDYETPPETEPETGVPVITTDNHVELVSNVLAIFSGKLYGDDILTAPDYTNPAFEYWPEFSYATNELISEPLDIVCSNGGTVSLVPETEGVDTLLFWNFGFENCQDGITMLDGQISRGIYESIVIDSTGFRRDDQTEVLQYSGYLSGRSLEHWYTTDMNFSLESANHSLIVKDSTAGFDFNSTTISGQFTVQADWTGDDIIAVKVLETPSPFDTLSPDDNKGKLELSAGPDNRLVLNADTGDVNTVDITITADGTTSTFTQPWSLWSDSLTFNSVSGY
ncbi:hypothetical protein [Granulosicoccus antarcticus]|uniref:Uncharacterized protein n=1 Tax=Granulosicoccus antarcticus IMCC3135 TaxID=1192854 RepID=A0A2Z2NMI3_9GAMM|nr:hypothetical protein [Granulosicoccus antarcticus]ASJ72419.1 hypothetical protein IMCC3135_11645 [Granulosicoccus antarcticus IMCC3135]